MQRSILGYFISNLIYDCPISEHMSGCSPLAYAVYVTVLLKYCQDWDDPSLMSVQYFITASFPVSIL